MSVKLVKEFFIKRRIVIDCDDFETMNKYIDIYNGTTNIFEGVYCYIDKIEENKAIIDNIFFDFDYDEDGIFFENVRKVTKYLMNNDIKFMIRFSGRGFHVFCLVEYALLSNPRAAIKNYVHEVHKINGTTSDSAVVGDLRRLRRVLHTINFKSGLYCIPLSYEDLHAKTYKEIQQYAQIDRGYEDIIYGNKEVSLLEYDTNLVSAIENAYSYSSDFSIDSSSKFPPCIQMFLSNPNLGYKERTDLIIYLRDMAYTEDEIINILEEHLSPEKFHHSTFEEKQVPRIFQKDMLLMRSCKTLKLFGMCPDNNCKGNNLYL